MRKIGLELEFDSQQITLSDIQLIENVLQPLVREQNQRISHREQLNTWTLKHDHCGYELTTPVMPATRRNFKKIQEVISGLRRACQANMRNNVQPHRNVCSRHCGMHVHIDVDDLSNRRLGHLMRVFRHYEDALFCLHAPSRQNNNFVIPLRRTIRSTPNRGMLSLRGLRTHCSAVNIRNNSVIEVRYGSSTLVGRKAINWIQLLVFMVEVVKRTRISSSSVSLESPSATIDDLKEFILNNESGTWLDRRRTNLTRWIDRRLDQLSSYQEATRARRQEQENQTQCSIPA